MLNLLKVVISTSNDVYENQALELSLFKNVNDHEQILYLWQNDSAVVIGRNQNPYIEVKIDSLINYNGKLARRLSGGGAVYHDIGNLNFTFIAKDKDFSLENNRLIILNAFSGMGFNANLSGRNDIEIDGFKVSGNAYYSKDGNKYHHGTLLITSESNKISEVLTPPKKKLELKGVKSVSSRVSNLSKLRGSIVTVQEVIDSLIKSFDAFYNDKSEIVRINPKGLDEYKFFSDPLWIYGDNKACDMQVQVEVNNRVITSEICLKNNLISYVKVYADSMDPNFSPLVEQEMIGKEILNENNFKKLLIDVAFKYMRGETC